jgi:hypothetical protein
MHWHMKDHNELPNVVSMVNKYLEEHGNAKSEIHSSTKELLGIA